MAHSKINFVATRFPAYAFPTSTRTISFISFSLMASGNAV
jgi:hypothetical protein